MIKLFVVPNLFRKVHKTLGKFAHLHSSIVINKTTDRMINCCLLMSRIIRSQISVLISNTRRVMTQLYTMVWYNNTTSSCIYKSVGVK